MTVLDAAPLCYKTDPKRRHLAGTLLIGVSVCMCCLFLVSLWWGDGAPSTTIYGADATWYYQCLIPAVFPVTVFFAYWIWLSSQYFRYA